MCRYIVYCFCVFLSVCLFAGLCGCGFLRRVYSQRRQILHSCSPASKVGNLPFWGTLLLHKPKIGRRISHRARWTKNRTGRSLACKPRLTEVRATFCCAVQIEVWCQFAALSFYFYLLVRYKETDVRFKTELESRKVRLKRKTATY